jgi:hypothetical protein
MVGRHICGREGVSGFGNVNLEQYARQDQIARVSRATVAGYDTPQQESPGTRTHLYTSSHVHTGNDPNKPHF